MAGKGPDGGLKFWQPKKRGDAPTEAPAQGRRDGGARKAGVVDGNVREWQPKAKEGNGDANGSAALKPWQPRASAGDGATKTFEPKAAPVASAVAPCAGCSKGLQLKLAPGSRETLRAKLQASVAMVSSFVLSLFEALLVESTPEAPAAPETDRTTWQDRGFSVVLRDGALVVQSVATDSPAGRAGLVVGDRIVGAENAPHINTIDLFAAKMASTTFQTNHVMIDRNGARLDLEIARA